MAERYTDEQVSAFKAKLLTARTVEVLAPGELDRVAKECGIRFDAAVAICRGHRRADVLPATMEAS